MTETISFGGRPVAHREVVRLRGRAIPTRFGLGDVGVGAWPGDLLAYRQEWEPFIAAHLAIWRNLNEQLENNPIAQECPTGIFDDSQIQSTNPAVRAFCASLAITREYTSSTHPLGILTQWNAWANKSSDEVLAGAGVMLQWHQGVVLRVGGPYKDQMLTIAKLFDIPVTLPDLPTLSTQQDIVSTIEGAYVSTKGILQIIGYGAAGALQVAGNTAQALTEGLSDTAKAIPKLVQNPFLWIGIAAAVAIVGGALVVYYKPRRPPARTAT
jgi:hypothetical protein